MWGKWAFYYRGASRLKHFQAKIFHILRFWAKRKSGESNLHQINPSLLTEVSEFGEKPL